jgi:hypothetical protein
MERLDTTNVILIVLATLSVVQTIVAIGFALAARRAYQSAARMFDTRLTPVMLRLEGVLANLEHTSAVVRTRTDDVGRALDRVHTTAGHLSSMWPRAAVVVGVAGGVLSAVKRWRAAGRRQSDVTVVG